MQTLTWNSYLIAILVFVGVSTVFACVRLHLAIRQMQMRPHKDTPWKLDEQRYMKAQRKKRRERSRKLWSTGVSGVSTIVFILAGGFSWLDGFVTSLPLGRIVEGALFFMGAVFIPRLGAFPFFIAEHIAKQNNRSEKEKKKDAERGLLATLLINAIVLAAVVGGLSLFVLGWEKVGPGIWVLWWALGSGILFLVQGGAGPLLASIAKPERITEGPLFDAIQVYAQSQDIDMERVFVAESLGKKEEGKANPTIAAFAGIGDFRRIVLLQSAIQTYTVPELVSIVAHETGHYMNRHMLRSWAVTSTILGLNMFVLSHFMHNPSLHAAVGIEHLGAGVSIALFSYLYAPVKLFLGLVRTALSRQHEKQADTFAVETYGHPADFASALQKIGEEYLVDPRPHWLHVLVMDEHPPLAKRIERVLTVGYGEGESVGAAQEAG